MSLPTQRTGKPITHRLCDSHSIATRNGRFVRELSARQRHHVVTHGREDAKPMLFAHGFGCDQGMWRDVWPQFADDYRIVLFDHVGYGKSDPSAFSRTRYESLTGYARDVLDIVHELDLQETIFVGHSVSAMIGALAAAEEPELFAHLVLVGPSPRYIDDEDYTGGFSRTDILELLDSLESNYVGWSQTMAPVIMGNPDQPELAQELAETFCRADFDISSHFARVTFLSDNRKDLARVRTPSLILQCSDDAIAPEVVGRYVHEALPNSELVLLNATGHCPNLSAPMETAAAIKSYLAA